jgi:hypothetical protein
MPITPSTLQTEHEWTVHSINIHGLFFERWCQQVVADAEGWTLDAVNYPVEFPPPNGPWRGKESALDIRASRGESINRLCLLIECKKNNPGFVDWVFFQKPKERTTQGFIVSQVANTLREAPNQGWDTASAINHLTSTFVITDEARETRANYLELRNTGNKTKTSNAAIQEAAYQVSLAKQAVLYEDVEICKRLQKLSPHAQPPWKRKLYFPTIVTTARLFVCEFDSRAVNPATGEINTTEAALSERDAIVFEYALPRHLQMAPLNVAEAYKEGLADAFTRLHILVVQSQQFPAFLKTFYGGDATPTEASALPPQQGVGDGQFDSPAESSRLNDIADP